MSKDTFKKQDAAGLVVRDDIHAILIGNTLRFHSFYSASLIFEMNSYFEEASNEQVDDFLSSPKIANVKPDVFKHALSPWSRRKIKSILSRGNFDQVSPSSWKKAAKKCNISLNFKGDKLVLPTNAKELQAVLRLLDDDYLDSIVTPDTTYQASSKRKVRG